MFAAPGKSAAEIAEEKGLKQESDTGAIEAICDQVLAANPKAVAEYKGGKQASINFLKGQVMKLSQGKANPCLRPRRCSKSRGPRPARWNPWNPMA
jgi:aspartyl-tRNA(Asn)/glutamyl-tRNA(Gln) amidotransferase subunit B